LKSCNSLTIIKLSSMETMQTNHARLCDKVWCCSFVFIWKYC